MADAVYIAGPMAGYPRWNFEAFDSAAESIREAGHVPCSPADMARAVGFDETATLSISMTPERYNECMRRDIGAMMRCDVVMLLKGWRMSAGAVREAMVAKWVGLPLVDERWLPVAVDLELTELL